MKRIIFTSLLLFFTVNLNAQNLYLESIIIEDDTEKVVSGAKVKIEDIDLTTHTNENGFFSFEKELPEGDYVVSVSKDGYDTKVFLVKQRENLKINLKEVRIKVVKKEAKRRKRIKKEKEKLAKEKLRKIEKERKKKEKLLKRQKEKLLEENTVVVEYDTIAAPKKAEKETVKIEEPEPISENQIKYAKILGIDVLKLTNKKLYDFIDEWMGAPYLMGGENEDGIDCSSFTQRLFGTGYGIYLERMAQKQFDSKNTDHFKGLNHLEEGDLLFFGKDKYNIIHVAVYLHNNKFVHATSRKVDGEAGVKISDITHPYWKGKFVSAGRRKEKIKQDQE